MTKVKDLILALQGLDPEAELMDQSEVQDMNATISLVSVTVEPKETHKGIVQLKWSDPLMTTIHKIVEHRKRAKYDSSL